MTGHNSRRNRYNDDSSDIDVRNDRTSRNRGKHKHKKNIYRSPQSSIYSSASSLVDDEVESKKLADEPKTKKKCCSSPCHKKTILIGALIFLQIAAFIGIGVFFGEQQREIDKHEHLLIYLHQLKFSCTKDIKKLADDMKHVVKDGGGEHAVVSQIIEDVKSIQKENDEVRNALTQYTGDISTLKNVVLEVNSTVLALYHNYTQHVANKNEASSEENKLIEGMQSDYSKDIAEIKANAEKMEETIRKLEEALAKEVGELNSNSKGAAESINELRTELLKEFESVAGKSTETNVTFHKFQEDYKKEKDLVTNALSELKDAYDKSMEAQKGEADDVTETLNDIRKKFKEDIQVMKDDFDGVSKTIDSVKETFQEEFTQVKGEFTQVKGELVNVNEAISFIKKEMKKEIGGVRGEVTGVNVTLFKLKRGVKKQFSAFKRSALAVNGTLIQLRKEYKKDTAILSVLKEDYEIGKKKKDEREDEKDESEETKDGGDDKGKKKGKNRPSRSDKALQMMVGLLKADIVDVNETLSQLLMDYKKDMAIVAVMNDFREEDTKKKDADGTDAEQGEDKQGDRGSRQGGRGRKNDREKTVSHERALQLRIATIVGDVVYVNNSVLELKRQFKKVVGGLIEDAVQVNSSLHELKTHHKKDIDSLKDAAGDVLLLLQDYKDDMVQLKTGSQGMNTTFLQFKEDYENDLTDIKVGTAQVNSTVLQLKKKIKKEIKEAAADAKQSLSELGDDIPDLKMKLADVNATMFQLHGVYAKDILIVYNLSTAANSSLDKLEEKQKKDVSKIKKDFNKIKQTLDHLKENFTGDTALLKTAVTEALVTVLQMHENHTRDIEALNSSFTANTPPHPDNTKDGESAVTSEKNGGGPSSNNNADMLKVGKLMNSLGVGGDGDAASEETPTTPMSPVIDKEFEANITKRIQAFTNSTKRVVKKLYKKLKDFTENVTALHQVVGDVNASLALLRNQTKELFNNSENVTETLSNLKKTYDEDMEEIRTFKEEAEGGFVGNISGLVSAGHDIGKLKIKQILPVKDMVSEMKENFTSVIPYVNKTVTKVLDTVIHVENKTRSDMVELKHANREVRKIVMKLKGYIGEIPELKISVDQVNNTVFQLNDIYVKDILVIYNNSVKVSNILMQLRHEYMKDIADIRFATSRMNHSIIRLRTNATTEFERSKRALTDLDTETKDSISKLDNYTRTEWAKLDNFTRTSVSELRLSDTGLFNSINDLKAVDSDVNSVIEDIKSNSNGFTDSINELKKRGFLHYPISDAIFVGFGRGLKENGGDASEGETQKFDSITSCVKYCKSKKEADAAFNGVRYDIYKRKCICEKSYLTHEDDQKYLHFWLAHDIE